MSVYGNAFRHGKRHSTESVYSRKLSGSSLDTHCMLVKGRQLWVRNESKLSDKRGTTVRIGC
jgi:hypothetical protein